MGLVSKLVAHSIIGAPSTGQIDYALNYRRTEAAFVLVDFGPNAPLRFRRWLRVKVSGQGPPKPSPAAEAQRSVSRALPLTSARMRHCVSRRWLQLKLGRSRDLGEQQVFSKVPGPFSKSREARPGSLPSWKASRSPTHPEVRPTQKTHPEGRLTQYGMHRKEEECKRKKERGM